MCCDTGSRTRAVALGGYPYWARVGEDGRGDRMGGHRNERRMEVATGIRKGLLPRCDDTQREGRLCRREREGDDDLV